LRVARIHRRRPETKKQRYQAAGKMVSVINTLSDALLSMI